MPFDIFDLVPLVVFIPLAGLVLNLLIGRRIGEKWAGIIGSLASAGAFGVAVTLAVALAGDPTPHVVWLAKWISIGSFHVDWALRVDTLSVLMMLVVSGVGTLIHIYSIGYMQVDVRHNGEPGRFSRFFVYLNLFIAAMMLLVTADNYLVLFVGWEGVGLCSYLLIGFWFEKGKDGIGNAQAAKKAMLVNRVGDFGLLAAIFMLFAAFSGSAGGLSFKSVFDGAAALPSGILLAVTLFMLLAVAGKSAQLPLYVWLPDAMAGPTPVSALIHAATMVTAGVYLIARSAPLFNLVPEAQWVVMWVGALTAFFAATIAIGQYDIKKVLAYSTISQLGFMVAAVGMGAYAAGMFHLVTHAFFKALLFLSAGSVILGMERGHEHGGHDAESVDPQDMRQMGGLYWKMKKTFWVFLAGALALSGIAPLAGFFSKDEILGAALEHNLPVFILLLVTAFLTAFYMGRQVFLVFFGKPRSSSAEHASESSRLIVLPLAVLAILSLVGGGLNLPGVVTLERWLEHSLEGNRAVEFSLPVALLSVGLALLGLFLAWRIYCRRKVMPHPGDPDPLARRLGPVWKGMESKWLVDEVYHGIIVRPFTAISNFAATKIDQNVIDGIVNGAGTAARSLATVWRRLQNGYVRWYALFVLLGVVVILGFLLWR
jgi:NADH-quinone oxidoreductase subunit L